jgi:hypothetical protein
LLIAAVRAVVEEEIAPLDVEYRAEVGRHTSGAGSGTPTGSRTF